MNAPHTAPLPRPAPARVLACGAYLKNRACLIDGHTVTWSAQHGDLSEPSACVALEQSLHQLLAQASGPVQAVAHDLHPDFHSTHLAHALAQQLGVPALAVQHHHAHIAVAVAEHGLAAPVIGLALDGTGLGDDGQAWGGELLVAGGGLHAHQWQRVSHLPLLALPGGDRAAREPWRMAAAVLHALGRGIEITPRFGPVVGEALAQGVQLLLQRGLHCAPSSSAGRWFDAAAGLLSLCHIQTHEAQAAMALEALAQDWLAAHPLARVPHASLNLLPVMAELLTLQANPGQAAAFFHLSLAQGLAARTIALAADQSTQQVVLGGGCFFNRVLSEHLTRALQLSGLQVWRADAAGVGDAGLALGQAWAAACTVRAQSDTALRAGVLTPFETT